jgi:hypothetical protein
VQERCQDHGIEPFCPLPISRVQSALTAENLVLFERYRARVVAQVKHTSGNWGRRRVFPDAT